MGLLTSRDTDVEWTPRNHVARRQWQLPQSAGELCVALGELRLLQRRCPGSTDLARHPVRLRRLTNTSTTHQAYRERRPLTLLSGAAGVLASTEVHWETLETNVKATLGLASQFGDAYRRADETERRWLNQAVVESIHVDVGGEVRKVLLAEPIRTLLDDGLVGGLQAEIEDRRTQEVGGLTSVKLVEDKGRNSNRKVGGLSKDLMVEVSGLEPPTSTLRT